MDNAQTVYCPRCDRGFTSMKSKKDAMLNMEKHVKNAHPDYDGWDQG